MKRHFSTLLLVFMTLVAFAANSILCRLALMTRAIGPLEFTAVRLASGVVALLPFLYLMRHSAVADEPPLLTPTLTRICAAASLFGYAIFFSLAYVQLEASIGALILFPTVQITMMGVAIWQGSRVSLLEWLGLIISFAGLVYLLWPGLTAPPLGGTVLMMLSGVSWGVYSLLGKTQKRPILATARNFLFSLPAIALIGLIVVGRLAQGSSSLWTPHGALLAIVSGAVASGFGYVLWYLMVRRISTTLAAVSQLVVPILAAIGGILFLSETPSVRLFVASTLIIGGIVIMIVGRTPPESSPTRPVVQ